MSSAYIEVVKVHTYPRPKTKTYPKRTFITGFVGCLVIFFGLSLLPFWEGFLSAYLKISARLSNGLLLLVGENSLVSGTTIWSRNYSINVASGCSALELAFFFFAAVVAFPTSVASWKQKFAGLVIGIPTLGVCNLIRIASLYWLGVHYPNLFNTAHHGVWPGLLLFFTLALCALWLQWILPKPEKAW